MGILNNKERVLDTIITLEGRKQISRGEFNISYASFSDRGAQYIKDSASGSADISNNLYFEATSLPIDQITFESDNDGKVIQSAPNNILKSFKGKLVNKSGSYITIDDNFSTNITHFLTSSLHNLNNLYPIGTTEYFNDDNIFELSTDNISFGLNDDFPIASNEIQMISIDKADNFFQDRRLSHLPNFKFLPPKNKSTQDNPEGSSLGQYIPINQYPILTYEDLLKELHGKEHHSIDFTKTSVNNNIFCQFFEVSADTLRKLDVIDFGSFQTSRKEVHVFFVGKIYIDRLGRSTFLNLFTMVFE